MEDCPFVRKKTFIIKNETPIPSNFWLRIKNYYSITCSCERKSQEDRIKSIYKRVFGHQKRLTEETLYKVKQPGSGVVIYVDPLNSDIGPFKAIPVDVYVFADTWGIYVDELEINITGLPQYTIGICVQVVGSPILLSISDRNEFNIPVIKYGVEASGIRLYDRKILLKNTSVLPIIIDWYTFVVKPVIETMPFTVIFDFLTPFTNKLASNLRANKQKNDSKVHLEEHTNMPRSKGLHSCYSVELSNIINDSTASSYFDSSFVTTSWTSDNEAVQDTGISFKRSSNKIVIDSNIDQGQSQNYITSDIISQSDNQEQQDIEVNISILPYYGSINSKICTVTPREMFILPNDNASLNINIQLDKYKGMNKMKKYFEGEFFCKIVGFLRIAPCDMYRDNYYFRQSRDYLPPIEIDVTANIVQPTLDLDISKYDRTFECCVNDVMQSHQKMLRLTKTLSLYNHDSKAIEISLETYEPFHIKSMSLYADTNPCKPGTMCISPYGCAEIEILCTVKAELIQAAMHTSSTQDLHQSKITLTELLHIIHSDKHHQNLELILQIWLPVLKLSSYTLDFGLVYIGDTKKLTLTIKNLSISSSNFRVNKKFKNKDFMIDLEDGVLPSHYTNESWSLTITVSFEPKYPGQSVETLEILTSIPYNTEECQLYGEGTLDEKYHIPGI